jgi:hypothetical protein
MMAVAQIKKPGTALPEDNIHASSAHTATR